MLFLLFYCTRYKQQFKPRQYNASFHQLLYFGSEFHIRPQLPHYAHGHGHKEPAYIFFVSLKSFYSEPYGPFLSTLADDVSGRKFPNLSSHV